MQQLIFDIPDYKYKECIQRILSLNIDDKEVSLIYDVKFLTPFTSLLVASFLNRFDFKVTSRIDENGKESSGYAENANFFHFAESSVKFEERNTNYSGNYTPIMKTSLDTYFRGSENIVERISERIAKVLSCGHRDIEDIFFYIVSEIFRNIPEHSQSFEGWHFSQRWEHDDYIEAEVALIDYGIGYRESLNFKEERVANDLEAIKLAIQPGVTGGITEYSHLREDEERDYLNSGYGLYIVTELCKKLKGQYVIVSKSAIATPKKITYLDNDKIFPGTAIKIKLQIPKKMSKEEFKNILSNIVNEGEQNSRSIAGAINIASSKSKNIN